MINIRYLISEKVLKCDFVLERITNIDDINILAKKYNVINFLEDKNINLIIEEIKKLIILILSKQKGEHGWKYFTDIYNELIYDFVINGRDNLQAISLISDLREIFRHEVGAVELDELSIEKTLACFQDIQKLQPNPKLSVPVDLGIDERILSVSNAVRRLKIQYDLEPKIKNGTIFFSQEEIKKICLKLEELIIQYGGFYLICEIQNILLNNYDHHQKRFHIVTPLNSMKNQNNRNPSIPFGYLFQIGLKNHGFNHSKPSHKILMEIFDLSKDIVACFDLEPYNIFQTKYKSGADCLDLIRKLALYDSNFKIPQIRCTDARTILEGIFLWIESSKYKKNISVQNIINFSVDLCECVKDKKSSVVLDRSDIKKITQKYSIDFDEIIKIFSHGSSPINENFLLPDDWNKVTSQNKPLIKLNQMKYWLPLQGYVLLSIIEAIFLYYRPNTASTSYGDFDSEVGDNFENYVKRLFNSKLIEFQSGKYPPGKIEEGQIDLAIEDKEFIYFLEIKKKILTKNARSGHDITLLIDLYQSLLNSQIQAIQHEIKLRKNKKIQFKDRNILNYNGQKFLKFSISLFDFGSLSDKMIVDQILSLFAFSQFTPQNIENKNKIEELNKKCDQFQKYFTELSTLTSNKEDLSFLLNNFFLSLPQLLIILDDVNSTSDFGKNILENSRISFSTMDFYYERSYFKKIKTALVN